MYRRQFLPTQTKEMQRQGEKEIGIFRSWFEKHVMLTDEDGCSESMLLLPWTQGRPSYRDEYREQVLLKVLVFKFADWFRRPSWTGQGWFFYFISVYAGAPEIILPGMSLLNPITLLNHSSSLVGETPYHCRFTKRQEWLPAAIGVIGGGGTDAYFTFFYRRHYGGSKDIKESRCWADCFRVEDI